MATYGRARSTRLLVVGLLLASLVTITVDARGGGRGPLAAVGRVAVAIISPLQEGVSAIVRPIGGFFSNMFRAGSLAEENERLRAQLAETGESLSELTVVRAENERLEQLLELVDQLDVSERFGAHVIAFSVTNFERSVVVDRGSSSEAVDDMPVIANTGRPGLVGRVVQVTPFSSVVQLMIDTDFFASARLVTSRESGILRGQGEEDLLLQLFDEVRDPIRVGEPVETAGYTTPSGETGVFPSGIPIGEVSAVETPEAGPTVVRVRPYVDFSKLEDVVLIRPVLPVPAEPQPTPSP